jgi:ABC-type polysaccharide/polyol phosphate export permease
MVFVSVFKSSLKNGTQYAPYLLAGVLLLTFFTQGLMQAADSISNGRGIFMKIRVDARLFCLSKVLSNLVNFFMGIIALLLITIFSGGSITPRLPLVLLVGFSLSVFTFGLSLIFSILFIRFDDVKYITTILLQLLTYLTPVFYPKEILSPNLRFFIAVNPLSSFLDVFRNVVNGTEIATIFDWAYMFTSSVLAFLIGIFVFQKLWVKTVVMM